MSSTKPVLRVLTGCTAVGKTEWALRWAEANGAEIISCDSLLFYRGMDIGTAKPTLAERTRVRHHLIDICELADGMNVARYVAAAKAALAEIAGRGQTALVVGGSGFYLKAFFGAVSDEVEVSPDVRAEVAGCSLDEAVERLRALNPAGLGNLDTSNPRRVTRALERCLASGQTLAQLLVNFAALAPPFAEWNVELTQIERAPAELDRRVSERVGMMLRAGLVDEVRGLLNCGLRENLSAARAIGYREVISHLDGSLALDQLAAEIAKNTRALVKKQRTWFRTQLPAHRVVAANTLRTPDELFGS